MTTLLPLPGPEDHRGHRGAAPADAAAGGEPAARGGDPGEQETGARGGTLAPVTRLPGAADPPRSARSGWAGVRRLLAELTGIPLLRAVLSVLVATLRNAWRHRVLGLSAEAGFWQLLSLPSALLGVLGTIGYFTKQIGRHTIDTLEADILSAAGRLVNPSSVNTLVRPTVSTVLNGGKAEIISLGFVLSLWSGSSAMATFVNTISIAYGQREGRSAVRSRFLALGLYLVSMMAGVVILPFLVVGPGEIDRIPAIARHHLVADLIAISYWPIIGGLSVLALAGLYRVAPPRPARWIAGLPGALVAVGLWFAGSVGLRAYVGFTFRRTAAYGALGAPVAVLLFFYITALAVLLGAELNAEIGLRRHRRPRRTVPA